MRELFPEYYGPSRDQLREVYQTGVVVLDANVLLALYRLSPAQRDELLAVLRKVRERLWIPYQAALEYQRNRLQVIQQQTSSYAKVRQEMQKAVGAGKKALESHQAHEALTHEVNELLDVTLTNLDQQLAKLQEKHSLGLDEALRDDPVRAALDDLLAGRVADPPDEPVRKERVETAKKRLQARTPPGYADADKDPEQAAGDYLLWAELLEQAPRFDGPLLLVTNDQKEDWFLRVSGKTVGPRPELVREMRERTPHAYHQHTLRRFLQLASEILETPVAASTIEKVTRPALSSSEVEALSTLEEVLDSALRDAGWRDSSPGHAEGGLHLVDYRYLRNRLAHDPGLYRRFEKWSAAEAVDALLQFVQQQEEVRRQRSKDGDGHPDAEGASE